MTNIEDKPRLLREHNDPNFAENLRRMFEAHLKGPGALHKAWDELHPNSSAPTPPAQP